MAASQNRTRGKIFSSHSAVGRLDHVARRGCTRQSMRAGKCAHQGRRASWSTRAASQAASPVACLAASQAASLAASPESGQRARGMA
eukprot:6207823-Pleurochrysis_carterae.AAC.1